MSTNDENKYRAAFSGERRYLSNMYNAPIMYNGMIFPSSESVYMLFKNDSEEWLDFVLNNHQHKVKTKSREIELVDNWEDIKIDRMRLALILKFSQHPELLEKLKKEDELIEKNNWGDTFWGVDIDTGEGDNILGILLDEVRRLLP